MDSSLLTRRSGLIVALALAVGGGYAAAQSKTPPAAGARPPAASNASAPASDMSSCPMQDMPAIADVTAENTADGAVIRLKAKKPADAQRVQEMAAMMAKHMTEGCADCCMMHGGMQRGGMMHGRGGPSSKPAAAPSNPPKR